MIVPSYGIPKAILKKRKVGTKMAYDIIWK